MRNDWLFEGKPFSIGKLVEEVKILSFLWVRNRAKAHSLTWDNWCNFNLSSMGV